MIWRHKLALAVILCFAASIGDAAFPAAAQTKPEGEMRFALYVTLAPAWLDPGESSPAISRRSGCCTHCMTLW